MEIIVSAVGKKLDVRLVTSFPKRLLADSMQFRPSDVNQYTP